MPTQRQVTSASHGHVLTNAAVWSPDSQWIVYDVRSHPAGSLFDGTRIEAVHVRSGEVRVLYESRNGACCGVATWSPTDGRIVFILGPEHPTKDWSYGISRRQGVIVDFDRPGVAVSLDARDLTAPFTPGALRGGTHVHVFSPDGQWVSFTYDDQLVQGGRNVGVALPRRVVVPGTHPRNHDGSHFGVLVSRTTDHPAPGSDQVRRAFEDAWVGQDHRSLAFIGEVLTARGETVNEVFVADLPVDPTIEGDGPIQGTMSSMPMPPRGVVQRRLTFTADRRFPGLCPPRHWVRSSPDGQRIAFLMRDDRGIAQIWTVRPASGETKQLTRNGFPVASAFTWSSDGRFIAHVADGSLFLTDSDSGKSHRLTEKSDVPPRPEAAVFSPDGRQIAFVRTVGGINQIFGCDL